MHREVDDGGIKGPIAGVTVVLTPIEEVTTLTPIEDLLAPLSARFFYSAH